MYKHLILFCLAFWGAMIGAAQEETLTLTFVGEQRLPTGEMFEDTEVGGLSSITYDAQRDVYYAISDDRVAHGPARFYTLSLDFDAEEFSGVIIESVTEILTSDEASFSRNTIDPEGLVYVPGSDTLFWSSEGDETGAPSLAEMTLEGQFVRAYDLPVYYLPDGKTGIAENQALEALTVLDSDHIITATENALSHDSSLITPTDGSPSRLLIFDAKSGDVESEFVYHVDLITPEGETSQSNGLTELVPLNDDHLLAMERAFVPGIGNTITFYRIDLSEATDIKGMVLLEGQTYTPVQKTPVLTLAEGDFGLDLDNIEGMTLGPVIDDQQTLVLVSDNNFNPDSQPFTQFLVFTLR